MMRYAKDAGDARWAVAAVAAVAVIAGSALLLSLGGGDSAVTKRATSVEPEPQPRALSGLRRTQSSRGPAAQGPMTARDEAPGSGRDFSPVTPAIAEEAPAAPEVEEGAATAGEEPQEAAPAAGKESSKKAPEKAPPAEAARDEEGLPEEPSPPEDAPREAKWSPPRFAGRMAEREWMVSVIRRYGLTDSAVTDAMLAVPRHEFVPAKHSRRAYADRPLPIGEGQTISQPYIVAEMTRQLRLRPDSRVLEIGTGSGYQAAVLTEFTAHVYTIEIIKPLADSAKKRFSSLGYHVVKTLHADGYHGWPEEAPFDAIIVTCAAGHIPPPLLKQLRPGGRMVIPVGGPHSIQSLMLVEKEEDGRVRSRSLMGVRFVPFVRRDK